MLIENEFNIKKKNHDVMKKFIDLLLFICLLPIFCNDKIPFPFGKYIFIVIG